MSTINLIPPRYAEARTNRRRRATWALTCVAVGMASSMTIAVSIANTPPIADGEARLAALRTQHIELAATGVALMEELEQRAGQVELLNRVARQPDWSTLLSDLAGWSASGCQLEQVSIRTAGGEPSFQVQIVGLSRSQEFIGQLVNGLRTSGRFARVTLGGTNRVDDSDPPTFRFDIHCVVEGLGTQAEALR